MVAGALDDIDAIAEYIHRNSPYHAQRVVEALLALGELIGEQPLIGRVVPELGDERVRERFLYS
ncbi:MAG: type II toxin-antitoxin system RelE/ParE family toxin [Dokdonella sp.]|nr:type II toxin-antitoxin system RelE/ParE family toxin [Dokdonella sp.]